MRALNFACARDYIASENQAQYVQEPIRSLSLYVTDLLAQSTGLAFIPRQNIGFSRYR